MEAQALANDVASDYLKELRGNRYHVFDFSVLCTHMNRLTDVVSHKSAGASKFQQTHSSIRTALDQVFSNEGVFEPELTDGYVSVVNPDISTGLETRKTVRTYEVLDTEQLTEGINQLSDDVRTLVISYILKCKCFNKVLTAALPF